jgi:ubiquinone/menaquinone biosynthesis C-methylase UbiE
MYAVSSAPQYRGNRWDTAEFFETGTQSIAVLNDDLHAEAPHLGRERALDFGCGLGRLTLALANHFREVIGVDIAPAMLERARLHAHSVENVSFRLNQTADLAQFDAASFDFVLSDITLLHVEPKNTRAYISEFVRVCKPGGVIKFHLPSPTRRQMIRAKVPRGIVALGYAIKSLRHPIMEVYGVEPAEVTAILERAGAEVLAVRSSAGPTYSSSSNFYTARRR